MSESVANVVFGKKSIPIFENVPLDFLLLTRKI